MIEYMFKSILSYLHGIGGSAMKPVPFIECSRLVFMGHRPRGWFMFD